MLRPDRATYQPPHWVHCINKTAHKAYQVDSEERKKVGGRVYQVCACEALPFSAGSVLQSRGWLFGGESGASVKL